jgi:hypothetical protein
MDPTIKTAIAGLLLLLALTSGIAFIQIPSRGGGDPQPEEIPIPTLTTQPPVSSTPVPTLSPITATPTPTVYGSIDSVDASQLTLGKPSYAYITITNTGTALITKERVEIIAGRDFGFPLGYQSRVMIQEFHDQVEPGSSTILQGVFNLPRYEGFISLEGVYTVTIKVYVNDWYPVGEWRGEVYLKG